MKALGITAMVIAIIAIFVPVIGPYLTFVTAILAAFAAGPGVTFGAVALLVNMINVFFLSPSLWITAAAVESEVEGAGAGVLAGMGVVFTAVNIIAALVLIVMHVLWKRRQSPT